MEVEKKGDRTIYHCQAVQKQSSTSPNQGGNKIVKKIIQLDSDKTRGIVNIYYVESYKRYNAMEIDPEHNSNHICKCEIF